MKLNWCFVCLLLTLALSLQGRAQGDPFKEARERMVTYDLKGRDITDEKVLKIMGKVERHLFVEKDLLEVAYNDYPLSIGDGQTISQPYIVALMTQWVNLKPTDKVLEIGTGSGYQAAVLGELVDQVYSIEIRETLAAQASKRLRELGYQKVKVRHGDGYFGWQEYAPFDAIIVTCAANHIPPPLLSQLKEGGRLIIPLGSTFFYQTLTLITKVGGGHKVRQISGVRFVPMTGEAEKK
jgi:protein-L-isoaspartate(D-aspartate) O-methyltransferase